MSALENIKLVFKSSPIPYLIIQPDSPRFTVAYANGAYLQATHHHLDDIIGKGISQGFAESPGEDANHKEQAIKNSLEQVLLFGKPQKLTLQKYGIRESWSYETHPLFDEDGSIAFILCNLLEVSPEASLVNTAFQHPLFNNYPDAVFTVDREGNFLSFNKVLLQLTECTKEELIDSSLRPFIASKNLELVFAKYNKAIEGEIQNMETEIITAKGKRRNIELTILPDIVNKEVVEVYLIARDITGIKNMERQLYKTYECLSHVLGNTSDGFFAVDENWIITYWNKQAERMIEKPGIKAKGTYLWDIYPKEIAQHFHSNYQSALDKKTSISFEDYFEAVNRWFELTIYPIEEGLAVFFKDITKRVEAEKKLHDVMRNYQRLFELSPVPKWVYDNETLRFLDVNQAAIDNYGYSREEFLTMTLKDIRPEADVNHLIDLIKNEVQPGAIYRNSTRHLKKSGEIIYVDTNSNSINFKGKNARMVLAIDVTKNIEAEKALINSEQRFKALVQEGSDLITIMDIEGNPLYISPNSKTILGLSEELLAGKNAFELIFEKDKQEVLDQLKQQLNKNSFKINPFRILNKNNEIQWFETFVTNMTKDPAVGGLVCNSRDVTQRIESEIIVRESIELYNLLSKATSDTVYDWDLSSNSLKWNKGFNDNFGYDDDEFYTINNWYKLIHPEDLIRVKNEIKVQIENKKTRIQSEYRFLCADGQYQFVLDRSFIIYKNGQSDRIIGSMQNITDRINYIQAIEKQNQTLNEISWMQSHVVRAPLANILGLLELLDYDENDFSKQELLAYLLKAATELDDIIKDIIKKAETLE
jgi:PAS domain S-box-containing protein